MHHIGGMEAVIWDLARQFARNGMRVTVLTTQLNAKQKEFDEDGVHVVALAVPAARYSRAWWRESRKYFVDNLMTSADVVLGCSSGANGLLPLKPSLPRVPFIFQAHGTALGEIISKWQTRELRSRVSSVKNVASLVKDLARQPRFDALVAVGGKAYSELRRSPFSSVISNDKVHLICNGIDDNVFYPDEASRLRMRELLGWVGSERIIVSASRLHRQKGVHLGLKAFSAYARHDALARYLVIGDGPERGELETSAEVLGIADKVRFVGAVPRESMPEYLRCGDVFLFTTLRQEGLPLNVLEALAVGMPVVVSEHVCSLIDAGDAMKGIGTGEEEIAQAIGAMLMTGRGMDGLLPDKYRLTVSARQYMAFMDRLCEGFQF